MRAHLRSAIRTALALVAAAAMPGPAAAAGLGGPEYFPNLPLITQDGKVIHFYDDVLKDKAVLVNLIYTRCSASCPLETAKLAQVQRMLGDRVGKDIFFYSISIDPEHDTPRALKAYARRFHVKPGWTFLTGKRDDIRIIGKKLGLASLADAASRDGHQPSLMIGRDSTGEWIRNSAMENPRFLTLTIQHFLDGFSGAPVKSYAEMGALKNVDRAQYLFRSRCAACHTIGRGDAVGPDLLDVGKRRDHVWLVRYVSNPDRLLAGGDPIAKELFARYRDVRMPNLDLSPEEVDLLLPYIEQESRRASTPPPKALSAR
ncbi:MAG TPA: SCO family protein [Myxococcales bacterium]|nr:SCO family protein [Myxococcales bacterium]